MVLKTFKLSKNPLVQLLYLILIVTTVSNQADEESAGPFRVQTDENINNVAKGTDPISSSVDKGSTINGEDPKLDDEDDPFRTLTLDLPESTTPEDLKPEEKELEAKNDQNIKGADSIPPNVDKGSTTNIGIMERNKNMIKGLYAGLTARNSINQPNENEINDIDLKKNNIDVTDDKIEDQKLVVEDDSTTPGDLKPEEKELEAQNNLNIEDGIISSKKKKKKKKKSEIIPDTQGSPQDNQAPPQDTQDMPHPLKPINPEDLTLSSLENVGIVKIKQLDPVTEAIRKKNKRSKIQKLIGLNILKNCFDKLLHSKIVIYESFIYTTEVKINIYYIFNLRIFKKKYQLLFKNNLFKVAINTNNIIQFELNFQSIEKLYIILFIIT